MQHPRHHACLTLALLCTVTALAAQDRGAKPKPPPKDDKVTAKDPVIRAIDKVIAQKGVSKKRQDWRTSLVAPPQQKFDPAREYRWHLDTNKGAITIRLLPETAPMHVTSAIYLTRHGFYDGLKLHRVIQGFMAQGGCPHGTGNGHPGYQIEGELADGVRHDEAGVLSTANEGRPRTDGSQFFLTFAPAPHLDGKHTIYGRVVEGMDTVRAIEACGGTPEADRPTEPLVIERAWITVAEKPKAADGADDAGKAEKGEGRGTGERQKEKEKGSE